MHTRYGTGTRILLLSDTSFARKSLDFSLSLFHLLLSLNTQLSVNNSIVSQEVAQTSMVQDWSQSQFDRREHVRDLTV